MIVAVVGSTLEDIQQVVEVVSDMVEIPVVDIIDLFREIPKQCGNLVGVRVVNHMPTSYNHKRLFLKSLEQEFGSVLIWGNIVLSEDVLQWILEQGGQVVVVSREKFQDYPEKVQETTEKYFADKPMQKYELEVRWKRVYERLSKNQGIRLVDFAQEESAVQLEDFVEGLLETNLEVTDCDSIPMDVLKSITDTWMKGEEKGMTLEDSIKKAMMDLGMDDVEEEPTQQQENPPKQKEKEKKQPPKPKTVEKPQPKQEDEEESEDDEAPNSLFCKISNGKMALLIPEGLTLEKQVIGGMSFDVATVSIPDLTNKKLQELELMVEKPAEEPKKKPFMNPPKQSTPKAESHPEKPKTAVKPKPTVSKKVVVEGNIDELRAEKARLDAEIKSARADRNLELVEELRKQRRAVRKKINAMKE